MAAPTPKPLTFAERGELAMLERTSLAGKPASAARLAALQARANIIAPLQESRFPPPPPPPPPAWETGPEATHIMRMEFDAEGGCTTYFEPRNLNSKNTSGVEIEIK
uniref:Uncharacterized protein n=1 Tax=viral metagenome TaxID=1070528 RepID=A0A6C0JIW2_9ZZZZ